MCLLVELLLRRPWLPGGTDVDQLGKIFAALGTPNEQNWPGANSQPGGSSAGSTQLVSSIMPSVLILGSAGTAYAMHGIVIGYSLWLQGPQKLVVCPSHLVLPALRACDAYSGVESLPSYVPFQPVNNPPSLRQQFPGASDDALDLLASMVALDPSKRPSGKTVICMTLEHNSETVG